MKVTKAYKLPIIIDSFSKKEIMRYYMSRAGVCFNYWISQVLESKVHLSTAGTGSLSNKMQRQAFNKAKAIIACSKEFNRNVTIPKTPIIEAPLQLSESRTSTFDYWIRVPNLFTKGKGVYLPVKAHTALNKSLNKGFKLSKEALLKIDNFGNFYIIAFVSKEFNKALPKINSIGCDVGINKAVTTSDGYKADSLKGIIRKDKLKRKCQQQSGHNKLTRKKTKTTIKQVLNKEAHKLISRAKKNGSNLVFEDSKAISPLSRGKLQGWASGYLVNRCKILGQENGVFVFEVNPAHTSTTCSHCLHKDKANRVKQTFKCVKCGYAIDADLNGAVNIARNGQERISKYILPKFDKAPKNLTLNRYYGSSK